MVEAASTGATPVERIGGSRRTGDISRRAYLVLFSVPGAALLGLLFAVPLLRFFMLSVSDGTVEPFERAIFDSLYALVFFDSVKIALWVTIICVVLAYPLALWLSRAGPVGLTLGMFALMLPFWTSVLVRTYAWMVLLGRNGVVNNLLKQLGLITDSLPLMHNMTGVLVGIVHVLLPYMVLPLYAAMLRVDPNLSLAAASLGAPPLQIFWRVTLPQLKAGFAAGVSLVFVLALGFFITPALLGGGKIMMISLLIEQQVREFLDWPFAAALSILLLAATLILRRALTMLFNEERPQ